MSTNIEKTAVLTTSDIQKVDYDTESVSSTGILEKLLDAGYEVFIVTTRTSFGSHDAWWKELVKSDNLFFPEGDGGFWANSPELINLWKGFYQKIGLPIKEEYDTWMPYLHDLESSEVMTAAKYKHKSKTEI